MTLSCMDLRNINLTVSSGPPTAGTLGILPGKHCSSRALFQPSPLPSRSFPEPEYICFGLTKQTLQHNSTTNYYLNESTLSFLSPVQRSHAAHRQWLLPSQETCTSFATGLPTCPPLGVESRALPESPKSPIRKKNTMWIEAEQIGSSAVIKL